MDVTIKKSLIFDTVKTEDKLLWNSQNEVYATSFYRFPSLAVSQIIIIKAQVCVLIDEWGRLDRVINSLYAMFLLLLWSSPIFF